jgi:hypothetical protein
MKRFYTGLLVLAFSAGLSFAANLPLMPSTPTFSEASQIVGTINALVSQLNGLPGYSGTSQLVSLGSSCANTTAGASPQVCNGQRGQVAYTTLGVTTTGSVMTTVVTDSAILATSQCTANWITAFTAGSGVTVATAVATAGSLSVISVNAGTTANAVTTGTLAFNCI